MFYPTKLANIELCSVSASENSCLSVTFSSMMQRNVTYTHIHIYIYIYIYIYIHTLSKECFVQNLSLLNKKVTGWEITKMKVGNEMEIFITLTKYNMCQEHEEGNHYLWCLPLPNSVQLIYKECDIPINVQR